MRAVTLPAYSGVFTSSIASTIDFLRNVLLGIVRKAPVGAYGGERVKGHVSLKMFWKYSTNGKDLCRHY